jgi:hypothetical protein
MQLGSIYLSTITISFCRIFELEHILTIDEKRSECNVLYPVTAKIFASAVENTPYKNEENHRDVTVSAPILDVIKGECAQSSSKILSP